MYLLKFLFSCLLAISLLVWFPTFSVNTPLGSQENFEDEKENGNNKTLSNGMNDEKSFGDLIQCTIALIDANNDLGYTILDQFTQSSSLDHKKAAYNIILYFLVKSKNIKATQKVGDLFKELIKKFKEKLQDTEVNFEQEDEHYNIVLTIVSYFAYNQENYHNDIIADFVFDLANSENPQIRQYISNYMLTKNFIISSIEWLNTKESSNLEDTIKKSLLNIIMENTNDSYELTHTIIDLILEKTDKGPTIVAQVITAAWLNSKNNRPILALLNNLLNALIKSKNSKKISLVKQTTLYLMANNDTSLLVYYIKGENDQERLIAMNVLLELLSNKKSYETAQKYLLPWLTSLSKSDSESQQNLSLTTIIYLANFVDTTELIDKLLTSFINSADPKLNDVVRIICAKQTVECKNSLTLEYLYTHKTCDSKNKNLILLKTLKTIIEKDKNNSEALEIIKDISSKLNADEKESFIKAIWGSQNNIELNEGINEDDTSSDENETISDEECEINIQDEALGIYEIVFAHIKNNDFAAAIATIEKALKMGYQDYLRDENNSQQSAQTLLYGMCKNMYENNRLFGNDSTDLLKETSQEFVKNWAGNLKKYDFLRFICYCDLTSCCTQSQQLSTQLKECLSSHQYLSTDLLAGILQDPTMQEKTLLCAIDHLVSYGANFNDANNIFKRTVLMTGLLNHKSSTINKIIKKHFKLIDFTKADIEKKNYWHYAAINNNFDLLSYLDKNKDTLDKKNLFSKNSLGYDVLWYAVEQDAEKLLSLCIEKMGLSNDQALNNFLYETTVIYFDTNEQAQQTATHVNLLHLAAMNNAPKCATILMNYIDSTKSDDLKRTVTHYATLYGATPVLKMLIEKSVDTVVNDKFGYTPLDYTLKWHPHEKYIKNKKLEKITKCTFANDNEIKKLLEEHNQLTENSYLAIKEVISRRSTALKLLLKTGAQQELNYKEHICHGDLKEIIVEAKKANTLQDKTVIYDDFNE